MPRSTWLWTNVYAASQEWRDFRVTWEIERWGIPRGLLGSTGGDVPPGKADVFLGTSPPLLLFRLDLARIESGSGLPSHDGTWSPLPDSEGLDPLAAQDRLADLVGAPVEPPSSDRERLHSEAHPAGSRGSAFSRIPDTAIEIEIDADPGADQDRAAMLAWFREVVHLLLLPCLKRHRFGYSTPFNTDTVTGPPYGLGANLYVTSRGRTKRLPVEGPDGSITPLAVGPDTSEVAAEILQLDGRGKESRVRGRTEAAIRMPQGNHDQPLQFTLNIPFELLGDAPDLNLVTGVLRTWIERFGAISAYVSMSTSRTMPQWGDTTSPWELENLGWHYTPDTPLVVSRGVHWITYLSPHLSQRVNVDDLEAVPDLRIEHPLEPTGVGLLIQVGPNPLDVRPETLSAVASACSAVLPHPE